MKDGMIIQGKWNKFLTLEGEELLLVKRKHPFILFLPIALTGLLVGFPPLLLSNLTTHSFQ